MLLINKKQWTILYLKKAKYKTNLNQLRSFIWRPVTVYYPLVDVIQTLVWRNKMSLHLDDARRAAGRIHTEQPLASASEMGWPPPDEHLSRSREALLKEKAQYGWPPSTYKFISAVCYIQTAIFLHYKTSYLNEEVNCTEAIWWKHLKICNTEKRLKFSATK
jgi:hypothetical protein